MITPDATKEMVLVIRNAPPAPVSSSQQLILSGSLSGSSNETGLFGVKFCYKIFVILY
jgi:hypothetical protein